MSPAKLTRRPVTPSFVHPDAEASSPPTSRGPLSVLAGDGWAAVLAPADAAAAALRLSRGRAVVVVRVAR